MGKYYDAAKIALHRKVIAACENIASKPCSEFASEIEDMLAKIKGLEVNGWSDSAETSFILAKQDTISSLGKIWGSIHNLFTGGEKTYNLLNEQLETLKKADSSYSELLRNEPDKDDYKESYTMSDGTVSYHISRRYDRAHDNWKAKKIKLEQQCTSMIENIDAYMTILEQINGAGLSGIFIDFNGLPQVIGFNNNDYIFTNIRALSTFEVEGIELEMLKGDELIAFQTANNIPANNNIIIGKMTENVNGVDFDIYCVFDLEDSENNDRFMTYTKDALTYLSQIDAPVLKRIRDSGSSIVFEQTYKCDGGSLDVGYWNAAAYCNSINRNIVMFNHNIKGEEWAYDYYVSSIIHETGHAYDFTLAYDSTGQTGIGISAIDSYNFRELIETEAANSLEQIDEFSLYSLEDFKNSPTEYFAECFKEYYSNQRGNLAFVSHGSYSFMHNLVSQEQ